MALHHFFDRVAANLRLLGAKSIFEFGCGEGLFVEQLKVRGISPELYVGLDLRGDAIAQAQTRHPEYEFRTQDLWDFDHPPFDLVIASQVLEHLPEPGLYIPKLLSLSKGLMLCTVPNEPYFRLVNLARGRDLLRLGDHPEHVNHWNAHEFRAFLEPYCETLNLEQPFPFLLYVGRAR